MKTLFESSAMLDRGGKPTVRDLLSSMVFNPVDGTIRLNGDRLVMQRAAVSVELRRELMRMLGPEETRVFLIRLGFLCGQADARFVQTAWPNLNVGDAFTAGTRLHMFSGVVRVETIHNDFDFRKKRFSGEFLWHDSVEAVEGRHHLQPGAGSVCWTQTGYASGYASEFFETLIVYKEIACTADGHKCCRVVGKPADVWGAQDAEVVLFRDRVVGHGQPIAPPRRPAALRPKESALAAVDDILLSPVRGPLDRLARSRLPALICGPEGSGRSRAAWYLHRRSGGLPADLRRIAAAGLTPDALANQIAAPVKPGRRGAGVQSLLIDEIETMPLPTQALLARMLAESAGNERPRIIALSTLGPDDLAGAGALRADLWLALSALPVRMPALDDRPEARLPLALALLPQLAERTGLPGVSLTDAAQDWIARSRWPGNLGELQATLTAALATLEDGEALTAPRLQAQRARIAPAPAADAAAASDTAGLATWLDAAFDAGGLALPDVERTIYDSAITRAKGNMAGAARLLGLTRAQLAYRVRTGTPSAPDPAPARRKPAGPD